MLELFDIWFKWKWKIAIVCSLAIIVSFIVTLPAIMPPYFASKAEFYPANPSAIDRNTLFSTERENYIAYFGSSDDIDRIISLARSSGLAGLIIDKYKLLEVYDIDTTKVKQWKYAVRKEFDDNYSSAKTDRNSIEINILEVEDKDIAFVCTAFNLKKEDLKCYIRKQSRQAQNLWMSQKS